ncbi:MAG: aminotransferase class III-fold pyridoxal phosphate-dependent enzyme, partial [Betaproteobacteria bacterium]|nr:aminotransferase class III-fold pyridoxal phosphate-dependent enzyme [Betaproteobacteria bacterium]
MQTSTLNRLLLNRSLAAVWHPCTQMKHHETLPLVPLARGKGVWLYDFDGRRYLDAISSWWVNLFGHGNPRINAALADQLDRLEHVILAGFTHEPKPQKSGFVSLANSYHGETLGALSVTDVALFKDTYAPLLMRSTQVPSPDWRLAETGESPAAYAARCAAALEHHLAEHHGRTAALIVEPLVQGATGMAMYHPEYLRLAREICDRYAVHLIADEIMTGFGRTGSFFAHQQAGITPDLLCLSKGITGGYL